jgi:hypothetical protein
MQSRRGFLFGFFAVAAGPACAQASDIEASVRRQLRAQGFTDIRVNRTFLGRLRFVAFNGRQRRELVINPATNVILRDFTQNLDLGDGENGQTDTPQEGSRSDVPGDEDDGDDSDGDDDDGRDGGGEDSSGGDEGEDGDDDD